MVIMTNLAKGGSPLNKITLIQTIILAILVIAVGYLYIDHFCASCHSGAQSQKLGYVRSYDILQNLPEVAAVKAQLDVESKDWLERGNKLQAELEAGMRTFDKESYAYSNTKRVQEQDKLKKMQERYQTFAQEAQQRIQQRQGELLEPLLGGVNKQIEDWGYKNGYAIIFGVEQPGVLVHADSSMDVTEQIRKVLKIPASDSANGTKGK